MRTTVKRIVVALSLLLIVWAPLRAQHNPYVDDKLIHFGFSLGVDFLSYGVEEADTLLLFHFSVTVPPYFPMPESLPDCSYNHMRIAAMQSARSPD